MLSYARREITTRLFKRSFKEGDVVYLRDSSNKIGISSKMSPPPPLHLPRIGPYLVIGARTPVYALQGKRKLQFVHHDRLKPCNDSSYPLWLQRKKHVFLNTMPIEEGGEPGHGARKAQSG